MEQNNENQTLQFKVMITFPNLLEKEIHEYNAFYGTDFKIIETIHDDVIFCHIQVSKYNISNIFGLGYSLAATQYNMRAKGEIDW